MSDKQKRSLIRIAIATVLFAILLYLQYGGVLYQVETLWVRVVITTVLSILIYVIGGSQVLFGAAEALTNGKVMHPYVLAVLASFGAFAFGDHLNAVAVILLYGLSEWVISWLHERKDCISKALRADLPGKVKVQRNGIMTEVRPEKVKEGEILVIEAGDVIPVDGKVLEGASTMNISPLTGSDGEKRVRVGDPVVSGCVNGQGVLIVETTKSGLDSTLSRIIRAAEDTENGQGDLFRNCTRWPIEKSLLLVGTAVILAVLFPLLKNESWSVWIRRAFAMLIPAAALAPLEAVPLTFSEGIGAFVRNHIFSKNSAVLENYADAVSLTVEKEGVLTSGSLKVTGIFPAENSDLSSDGLLAEAAAMTLLSRSPEAKAIRAACGKGAVPAKITETEEIEGLGIAGKMNGRPFLIGDEQFFEKYGFSDLPDPEADGRLLYIAGNGQYLGAVAVSENLKENVQEDLEGIRKAGLEKLILLSKESDDAVKKTAETLGFDGTITGTEDEIFVKREELRRNGKAAAFAGMMHSEEDLKYADVNIAVNALMDPESALEAEIMIMDDDLSKVGKAFAISKKVKRTVWAIMILTGVSSILLFTFTGSGMMTMGPAALVMTIVFFISVFLGFRIRKAG